MLSLFYKAIAKGARFIVVPISRKVNPNPYGAAYFLIDPTGIVDPGPNYLPKKNLPSDPVLGITPILRRILEVFLNRVVGWKPLPIPPEVGNSVFTPEML